MELPQDEDLTPAEKKARVHISPADRSLYPKSYYWPFEKILKFTKTLPAPPTKKIYSGLEATVWDPIIRGYDDWAVPNHDEGLEGMMRMMSTQHIYDVRGGGSVEAPGLQMNKLFAAPIKRLLAEHSKTTEYKELQQKIFVMKYSLSPFHTSPLDDFDERCEDENVQVWRLITCFGETNLDTLHDRILGPAMGWTRHYHSYKFVVPTSGACFGPKESSAIDQMHAMSQQMYMLDSRRYQLCHVLRKPGQRLVYIYDLGDKWHHNLELLQVADKDAALFLPAADDQVKTALVKQYGSTMPKLFGVQLLAGELNCPPEDSNGCNEMGKYGTILKQGKKYCSREASGAMNWKEHGIRNAYRFDLAAHALRLSNAISGKSSSKSGQKVFNFAVGGGEMPKHLLPQTKAGEKVKDRCLGDLNACRPMSETIKTRPDKAKEAVCATCGRQPTIERGKKTPLLHCSACKGSWYCGKECQMSDWENHKGRCRAMKKERAAYKKELMESTVDIVD